MSPTPPKSEGDLSEAVDKWLDGWKVLQNHKGYQMSIRIRVTALKMLMVGRARDQFEVWGEGIKDDDEGTFVDLLNKVQDYATRRRLEANLSKGKSDPMDLGEVGGYPSEQQWSSDWEQWDSSQQGSDGQWTSGGDVDALGKGKGGGKGDKGKGKGKGVFQGNCYTCGEWGHTGKFCPLKGKGKGKSGFLGICHSSGGDE